MDVHTKEQRSYNMSRVKSKNTRPEKILFLELKKAGYNFKKHYNFPGKPDVAFLGNKVAVFIDGEFWHGKDFKDWKDKITQFWLKKISDNIRRDRKNNRLLRKQGWTVIHLWGRDVVKNPDKILSRIRKIVEKADLKRPVLV